MVEESGLSKPTILKGIHELRSKRQLAPEEGRVRKAGGGRKPIEEGDPDFTRLLEQVMDESTVGDPMSPLKWNSKSTYQIQEYLASQGHPVSEDTIQRRLRKLDYSLQANRKDKEGESHADRDRQGARAGRLAACWLRCATSLSVPLGLPLGSEQVLQLAGKWVAVLAVADPTLGAAAEALTARLGRAPPREGARGLVHGTLYPRHLLDLGDGPGVIDWDHFGQGPAELDAGAFLATLWRKGLRRPELSDETARAAEAFLAGTAGFFDQQVLAWYRAAMLLRLASHLTRRRGERLIRIRELLREAGRLAGIAARRH